MLGNGHVRFGGRRRGNPPAKAGHGASPSTLYIPFDPQAANLMFMLVSRRYERASMIVTSNKPFSGWGEIFGDDVTAAAMIDRLVHHAEILALKGDSYRLKDRDLARPIAATTVETP
jgi:IstB-like ATP binding protein